ncbi:MAG: EscD/YscD/HrpQ family type III secretion system periplasmic domain-containing protein [Pseudomonadota bacterium]
MIKVVFKNLGYDGVELELTPGNPICIGTQNDLDIILEAGSVSFESVQISVYEDQSILIDCADVKAVKLNGEIELARPLHLTESAEISLDGFNFLINFDENTADDTNDREEVGFSKIKEEKFNNIMDSEKEIKWFSATKLITISILLLIMIGVILAVFKNDSDKNKSAERNSDIAGRAFLSSQTMSEQFPEVEYSINSNLGERVISLYGWVKNKESLNQLSRMVLRDGSVLSMKVSIVDEKLNTVSSVMTDFDLQNSLSVKYQSNGRFVFYGIVTDFEKWNKTKAMIEAALIPGTMIDKTKSLKTYMAELEVYARHLDLFDSILISQEDQRIKVVLVNVRPEQSKRIEVFRDLIADNPLVPVDIKELHISDSDIRSVVFSSNPYIKLKNGLKVTEGDLLEGGIQIKKITREYFIIVIDDRTITVPLP